MVLLLGVFLVITTITLNIIFIPKYGITGSAFATFISVLAYNISKVLFVKYAFKITPFTLGSLKTLILILFCFVLFYYWDFPFHPIINIGLKSLLFSIIYGIIVYAFNFSEDVSSLLNRFVKRLK